MSRWKVPFILQVMPAPAETQILWADPGLGQLQVDEDRGRGGHENECGYSQDVRRPSVRMPAHDLLVVGNVKDDGDEDRRRQSVQNGGIDQRLDRRDAYVIQR